MTGELDVSWQLLRQITREWAGDSAALEEVTSLSGGCINTTVCLKTTAGDRAVLKITPHRIDRHYSDEACQLKLLRDAGLPVPRVYVCHIGTLDQPNSYLLMEYVDGVDLAGAKARCTPQEFDHLQHELAELVWKLHSRTSTHYMRVTGEDLPSKTYEQWPQFYRDVFDGIWHEVEKSNVLATKCRKTVGKVHERLPRLLAHDDCPRLVHWDLWNTNVLAAPNGDGRWHVTAVLDPNCKYAHAEAELAYLELFHTVTPPFMKAYQHLHKLPPEYHRVRKPVYQLYSLLNHVRLFGHGYLKPTTEAIERVAALV